MNRSRRLVPASGLVLGLVLVLTGCGGEQPPAGGGSATPSTSAGATTGAATGEGTPGSAAQEYPDVESVELTPTGDGAYDVAVTISSPYDTPERYADGWRVLTPDGEVLGTHELSHDHASEQPFTRTQYDLQIPDGVEEVTVEGRDLENGFGGGIRTVSVPS